MKISRFLVLLIFPLYLVSCRPTQTIPNYLQNVNDSTGKGAVQLVELRVQKNDLLGIQVYSASTKPDISDRIYNLPSTGSAAGSSSGAGSGGFLVDAYGNIEYPQIGVLHAEGLTKQQLADTIKRKINEKDSVLTNPSVIIRFLNLKVTVLGEVNAQGVLTIPGERVTIIEAIGLAGGITDFGLKDKIKVLREIDGKREVGIVDLSQQNIFESPYYNLMQNDVVMVDPTRKKAKAADQSLVIQRVGFGLSIITAIALLYNIFQQ